MVNAGMDAPLKSVALQRGFEFRLFPDNLPQEFRAFDRAVDQLSVGRPGKVGLLELTFALVCGKTRLMHHFQQAPLQIFRPLYVDPVCPEMAFIYLIQIGGGTIQGDRYRLDLNCEAGSAVHFTTQASTKIYKADQNYATHIVIITAGAGSFVEYLPDTNIPYRHSRFLQRTTVVIDPTATAIVGETVLPDRVAYGEFHDCDLFVGQTEVRRLDGKLLFADVTHLDPRKASRKTKGLLGPYDVLATLYLITTKFDPKVLIDRVRSNLSLQGAVLAGVSELPNSCGVSVRLPGQKPARPCWRRNMPRRTKREWRSLKHRLLT